MLRSSPSHQSGTAPSSGTMPFVLADPTPFPELNRVLAVLVGRASVILGEDLVGAYLVGSFAVGDADEHSDCDVLLPTARPVTAEQETALRRLHADLPSPDGHWNREVEGSYPPVDELRTLDALGRRWLYVDRGARVMEWSPHCNTHEHRWTLRNRGVVLAGPPPETLVDPLPAGALADRMRSEIPTLMDRLLDWIDVGAVAWGQRYAVTTLCRMLYTVATDEIASKRAALVWARDALDPRWVPLVDAALAGRALGWDPEDRPSAASVAETRAFAEHAAESVESGSDLGKQIVG